MEETRGGGGGGGGGRDRFRIVGTVSQLSSVGDRDSASHHLPSGRHGGEDRLTHGGHKARSGGQDGRQGLQAEGRAGGGSGEICRPLSHPRLQDVHQGNDHRRQDH